MFAITWSSQHSRFAALCAALLQPLVCGLISGLAYTRTNHYYLADCWALFTLWHICVVTLGFFCLLLADHDLWPTVSRCALVVSGPAFNFGNTVWVVTLDECSRGHGALHPEAELLFMHLKAYHKAGWRAGILLSVNQSVLSRRRWRMEVFVLCSKMMRRMTSKLKYKL